MGQIAVTVCDKCKFDKWELDNNDIIVDEAIVENKPLKAYSLKCPNCGAEFFCGVNTEKLSDLHKGYEKFLQAQCTMSKGRFLILDKSWKHKLEIEHDRIARVYKRMRHGKV